MSTVLCPNNKIIPGMDNSLIGLASQAMLSCREATGLNHLKRTSEIERSSGTAQGKGFVVEPRNSLIAVSVNDRNDLRPVGYSPFSLENVYQKTPFLSSVLTR